MKESKGGEREKRKRVEIEKEELMHVLEGKWFTNFLFVNRFPYFP
jgi:hypothetical protein